MRDADCSNLMLKDNASLCPVAHHTLLGAALPFICLSFDMQMRAYARRRKANNLSSRMLAPALCATEPSKLHAIFYAQEREIKIT